MRIREPSSFQLQNELANHIRHREALLSAMPEIDDQTLADTLEGLTDLNEMVAETLRSALVDEALGKGLQVRVKDMRERHERLVGRAKAKRTIACKAMSNGNIKKITDSEFTASLRNGPPKLHIEAEHEIPHEYWIPQPSKLDRQSVLAALKANEGVPGARLQKRELQLSVRTK